ncbi:MAG: NAD-dependent epimerase/dehydratase family protein, partial [Aestuariivirgaceae bacterium]
IVQGDLADKQALGELVSGAASVIHIAGAIAAPTRQVFDAVNVAGTANVALAAAEAGVGRFVHLSSMAAREPQLSDYAASKRAGEAALIDAAGAMSWTILRPPAVYGPGDEATLPLIAQLTRNHAVLPGATDNRTSLIHVDDLAAALIMLATSTTPRDTVHELDDGKAGGYSWRELVDIAARCENRQVKLHHLPRPVMTVAGYAAKLASMMTGKPAMLTPGKVRELYHPDWVAHDNLLSKATGWQPAIGFAEGFAATLDWYRRHQWLPDPGAKARTRNKTDQRETTT